MRENLEPSRVPHRTALCSDQELVRGWLCRLRRNRRWLEAFDNQPDAQQQLPDELWTDHNAPRHGAWLDDPEQDADEASEEHRAGDEPQHGHGPWHQGGAVHQVAQQQPVADADDEAWPEEERPIMNGDERLADRDERGGICARSSRDVLPQRHDRKQAEDAHGDEDGFDDAFPSDRGGASPPIQDRIRSVNR